MKMFRKRSGKFIAAAVCGIIAFTSVTFAADGYKDISVYYHDIGIVINGVPLTPKDATGKTVEPFIYEGTTYLPVRAIGEAFGNTVTWDGETSTVYVGETPGQVTYLVNVLEPYESSGYSTPATFKIAGKDYSNGFTFGNHDGYAIYNLDGKYNSLEFDVGHIDGSKMTEQKCNIYLDGKITQTYEFHSEDMIKHIVVPLNHALQLKITTETGYGGGGQYASYGYANAKLS